MRKEYFNIGDKVYLNHCSRYINSDSKSPSSNNPINVVGEVLHLTEDGLHYINWSNGEKNGGYEYKDLIASSYHPNTSVLSKTPKSETKKPTQLTKSKLITLLNDAYRDGFVASMDGKAFAPNPYTGHLLDALLELQK